MRSSSNFRTYVGVLLLLYFLMLAVFRYHMRGVAGLYDLLWLCNQSLLIAGFACVFNWPELIACCCGAVAFSHVSWNLDIVLYFFRGFMPFGTASYVLWPQTSRWEIVTTLHHVWMIPLLGVVLHMQPIQKPTSHSSRTSTSHSQGFFSSPRRFLWRHGYRGMMLPAVLVPLSFYLTPKTLDGVYLNVNMSHEFWDDAPLQFLKMFNKSHNLILAAWIVGLGGFLNMIAWSAVLSIQYVLSKLVSLFAAPAKSKKA